MNKADTARIKKIIEYKIDSIDIINHTQKHFSDYDLRSSDIKKAECQIGIDIRIKGDKSCIAIPMKVVMASEHEGKKCEFFSTEAVYTYRIKKFKSLFMTDKPNQYKIPDEFMRILIGTALGGMRGIMVASTTIAEYKKIILPLIETSKLLEDIKKRET
jgi:hypothetical protein